MKLISKFVIIIGAFYLSVIIAVLYIWYTEDQTILTAKTTMVEKNKIIFKRLLNLKTESHKAGVYDYTYWDDMVEFTKSRDPKWAKINLDEFITTYNLNYVLVYDTQSNLIFSKSDQNNLKKIEKSIDLTKLNYQDPAFLDYFILVDGVVAKVFQAPIQPSEDTKRESKPHGYMIGVKRLDKTFIKDIGTFLHQKVYLLSSNNSLEGDYKYALLDSSNNVIQHIHVNLNNTLYTAVNELFIKILLSLLVMIFLSLIGFTWLINCQVLRPLENLSIIDELTNTYNRRHYNEAIPRILKSAKRANKLINYAMIDVDFFKPYNDNYGHYQGDIALKQIATCLKDSLNRPDDIIFRLGGEEFLIISEGESKEKALSFFDKIRKNIEELKIPHKLNPVSEYITISVGLVSKSANDIHDIEDLYREADGLLYEAKGSGKNKVISNN